MLDDNDGHGFFEMLGDSLVTGPTAHQRQRLQGNLDRAMTTVFSLPHSRAHPEAARRAARRSGNDVRGHPS